MHCLETIIKLNAEKKPETRPEDMTIEELYNELKPIKSYRIDDMRR